MTEAIRILTPIGRIVTGDLWEPRTKDAEGNPLTIKNGPNAGQPRQEYYFAIAIDKQDPGWPELWNTIHGAARAAFPQKFGADGNAIGSFSWKFTDGDSQVPNSRGNKPCDQEGWAGHYLLHFSSSFAPKVVSKGGEEVLTDPHLVRRGYYVRVSGTVRGNESTQQPGVYLNHDMVEFNGFGPEIHIGPDAKATFGNDAPTYTPPGMSAAPLAADSPPPATGTGGPPPAHTPASNAPPPAPEVKPATDILNGPATVLRLASNGVAFSEAQLQAAGYTPEQIAALPLATT